MYGFKKQLSGCAIRQIRPWRLSLYTVFELAGLILSTAAHANGPPIFKLLQRTGRYHLKATASSQLFASIMQSRYATAPCLAYLGEWPRRFVDHWPTLRKQRLAHKTHKKWQNSENRWVCVGEIFCCIGRSKSGIVKPPGVRYPPVLWEKRRTL